MKNLIRIALKEGMTYLEYNLLFKRLVQHGETTGEVTPEKIFFTKLNFTRSKRLNKTLFLTDIQAGKFKALKSPQIWLVIVEPWCADGAQTLSLLNKMAECSTKITLKIVLRDNHPELMDAFLTGGNRAIPKLIILDENLKVIKDWGPRSEAATEMVRGYKEKHGVLDAEFKEKLQVWYHKDRGQSIIKEISKLSTQDLEVEANAV